jgi:phage virion morphogenesis protein
MTTFTIEVHDQAVRGALNALAARVANMAPTLEAIGEKIVERVDQRFTDQAGPDGVKWQANSAATKRAKRGKPILEDSGLLRQQIMARVSGDTLTVSAGQKYAAIHQFGGEIARKAGQITTRHRTDAKGELLRSKIMNGKGLIFANPKKHAASRVMERTFEHAAYTIKIPARPFLPIRADGSLYPAEQAEILAQINAWLAGQDGA